jgi:hypothetical protein
MNGQRKSNKRQNDFIKQDLTLKLDVSFKDSVQGTKKVFLYNMKDNKI